METKIIYTVITNVDYSLNTPVIMPGWRYMCFTNQKHINPKGWEIIQIKNQGLTNQKLSRAIKILHHQFLPSCDISIYIDSRFTPNCNLDKFVKNSLKNYDITIMQHNRRDCAYEEAKYLMEKKIIISKLLTQQIQDYKVKGFPEHFGLFAPGIMIRKCSNLLLNNMMELWWKEVYKYTYRDQISLAYIIWKNPKIKVNLIPFRKTYELFMDRTK